MLSKEYSESYLQVFEACKMAIAGCGFSLDSENREGGVIRASAPLTVVSWGEDIVIKVERTGEGRTRVTVESLPKAQLFDWGKSGENELRIMTHLDQALR